MIMGFSGTREGMTEVQKTMLRRLLGEYTPTEFHHGDCVGADAEAHDIVRELFDPFACRIIIHPPRAVADRAWKEGDTILEAREFLTRNRDIVNACDVLIVTPKESQEQLRSGTWATYRWAVKTGKKRHVVYP